MNSSRKFVGRVLSLLMVLVAAWLLWSGIYKPILLILGVFSCGLSVYLAYRTGFFKSVTGLHLIPQLPKYWLWLSGEIIKSSFEVAKIVLDPKLPISPTVIDIEAKPEGQIGQAILGNSITLSPGTVTLDVFDGRLKVHCLTKEGAEDLISSGVNERCADLTKY